VSVLRREGAKRKELCVMRRMRKPVAALTVAVWVAAAGSAGALTYELNHGLRVGQTVSPQQPVFATVPAEDVAPASPPIPVLQVPTVRIVGHAARRAAMEPTVRPPTDIAVMHCKDWQELQMGSGKVQVCE
jgi:hypothetical protein